MIRKYHPKDRDQIRKICYVTATDERFKENPELLWTLYADYYTECEPESLFVAVNEEDTAIGYILCAKNPREYYKRFKKDYLPRVKELDKKMATAKKLEKILDYALARSYPAHLHIDILPEYQRMGLGHKLTDALINHLKEEGVAGIHLGVGSDNEKGVRFYEKYGFKRLLSIGGGVVFGLKTK